MITITQNAAAQIRKSAQQQKAGDMFLRIAIRLEEDGTFEYGIGFDEENSGDIHLKSEGIDVLIADSCKDLLTGSVLDFVEIAPGQHQFIFMNPNDPKHNAGGGEGKSDS